MITQSESMFEILNINGIRDKSYLYVKDYGNKFRKLEPYNVHFHERIFGIGWGKTRLIISVDYKGLQAFWGSMPLTGLYTEIDETKLRSIITFFHCSRTKQETIMKYFTKIENTGTEYEYKIEQKFKLSSPLDKSFGKIYATVKLK